MDDQSGAASRRGRSTTVAQLMRPAVTTVQRHSHVAAAAYMMKHAGDTAVVVTSDDGTGRPIGIFTETDITDAVAEGKDPNESRIDELAGRVPVTVRPATTVNEAAQALLTTGIRHLPVVDDGRLVGIIDVTDVCRALLGETTRA
jgi:CBS domain-containing protein